MVKVSYEQKPFRREVIRTYGAKITPSPSETTEVGRKILAEFPGTGGSLGCAISEAVEAATHQEGYRYVLGSVLNQVLLHQTVIGLETMTAMDKYGIKPDVIIGCAGGLRYHGMSSILSQLYDDGLMEARTVEQTEVFRAAQEFARVEGILPAPESSHAIKVAIDEALKCKETDEEKTILFGLTGTGYFDMYAYKAFNDGTMSDYIPSDEDLAKGFAGIPRFPGNEF